MGVLYNSSKESVTPNKAHILPGLTAARGSEELSDVEEHHRFFFVSQTLALSSVFKAPLISIRPSGISEGALRCCDNGGVPSH